MAECICGLDEPCTGHCSRHDCDLHGYPCSECDREWREAHPRTYAVIGSGIQSKFTKAKRADLAAHTEPCRWNCEAKP